MAADYGREVPRRVRLSSEFDAPEHIRNSAGDIVEVVPPPDGVEVDRCSLFVRLHRHDGGTELERVYEHEFISTDSF